MNKQYRYTLRKTTLGLASVAIAAFLAGQAPTVLGAEEAEHVVNETVLPPEETDASLTLEEETAVSANSDTRSIEKAEVSNDEIMPMSDATETFENETTEDVFNYANDEAEIKDFNEEERYRSTQLEQGGGTRKDFRDTPSLDKHVDGFKYNTAEPSVTSPDKTRWGVQIEFDKEKGNEPILISTLLTEASLVGY